MLYNNIVEGTFVNRINRFLANVIIDGDLIKAHVKNTGRLRELLTPNAKIYLQCADNKTQRKTTHSIIAVEKDDIIINIDSQAPNQVIEDALKEHMIIENLSSIKREQTYGKSRFDFYYETTSKKGFIEVKGATLIKENCISFPDAKTTRGLKHINELITARENGYEAMVIFVIQLTSNKPFSPNYDADKDFACALTRALKKGVNIKAYYCNVTPSSIRIFNEAKVLLDKL